MQERKIGPHLWIKLHDSGIVIAPSAQTPNPNCPLKRSASFPEKELRSGLERSSSRLSSVCMTCMTPPCISSVETKRPNILKRWEKGEAFLPVSAYVMPNNAQQFEEAFTRSTCAHLKIFSCQGSHRKLPQTSLGLSSQATTMSDYCQSQNVTICWRNKKLLVSGL